MERKVVQVSSLIHKLIVSNPLDVEALGVAMTELLQIVRLGDHEQLSASLLCSVFRATLRVSGELQAIACALTASTCVTVAQRRELASAGVVSCVVDALKHHDDDVAVAERACAAIAQVVVGCDRAQDAVLSRGGIAVVITTLRGRFRGVPGVVVEACSALCNLAVSNSSAKDAIVRQGGVAAIIAGMSAHPDRPEVANGACAALWNICAKNEPAKKQVVEENGLPLILAAMERFPTNKWTAHFACAALWNLSASDAIRPKVVAAGAIPAIVAALARHRGVALVENRACGALRNIAIDPRNAVLIAQAGGIPAVAATLGAHPEATELHKICLESLSVFASSTALAEHLWPDPGGFAAASSVVAENFKADPAIGASVFTLLARAVVPVEIEDVIRELEEARKISASPPQDEAARLSASLDTLFREHCGSVAPLHEAALRDVEKACEVLQSIQARISFAASLEGQDSATLQKLISERDSKRSEFLGAVGRFVGLDKKEFDLSIPAPLAAVPTWDPATIGPEGTPEKMTWQGKATEFLRPIASVMHDWLRRSMDERDEISRLVESKAENLAAHLRSSADVISGARAITGTHGTVGSASCSLIATIARLRQFVQKAESTCPVQVPQQILARIAAFQLFQARDESAKRIASLPQQYAEATGVWRSCGVTEGAKWVDSSAATSAAEHLLDSSCLIEELVAKRKRLISQNKDEEVAAVDKELVAIRCRIPDLIKDFDFQLGQLSTHVATHWPEAAVQLNGLYPVRGAQARAVVSAAKEPPSGATLNFFEDRKHISPSTTFARLGGSSWVLKSFPVPTVQAAKDFGGAYRAAKRLAHPGILRPSFFFIEEPDSVAFAVFQYQQKGNLSQHIIQQNPGFVGLVSLRLLEATHFLHSHGIVHGRIKPENVLVSDAGEPLLDDILGALLPVASGPHRSSPFTAPEVSKGGPTSVAADIYSVGAVLELLGANLGATMIKESPEMRPSAIAAIELLPKGQREEQAVVALGPSPKHWDWAPLRSDVVASSSLPRLVDAPELVPSLQMVAGAVRITRVVRIENVSRWNEFSTKRAEMRAVARRAPVAKGDSPEDVSEWARTFMWLDSSRGVRETLLFHAADSAVAASVSQHGMQFRRRDGTMGSAFYFTDSIAPLSSAKEHGLFTALVVRVLCGDQIVLRRPFPILNSPPCKAGCSQGSENSRCRHARYHSCAFSDTIAVFDPSMCYPEFIVTFTC